MRVIVLALITTLLMPIFVVAESETDRAWKRDFFNEMTSDENMAEGLHQLISVGVASELAIEIITCRVKESKVLFMSTSRKEIEKIYLNNPYKSGRALGLDADKRCAIKIRMINNQ